MHRIKKERNFEDIGQIIELFHKIHPRLNFENYFSSFSEKKAGEHHLNKKHPEFSLLKQSLFSQLFETWAMYHLNLLENDEYIGIDRLHTGNFTSQEVNDWKREAKRLKDLGRKRQ